MAVLNDEQVMLRDMAREWADNEAPVTAFRKLRAAAPADGFDPGGMGRDRADGLGGRRGARGAWRLGVRLSVAGARDRAARPQPRRLAARLGRPRRNRDRDGFRRGREGRVAAEDRRGRAGRDAGGGRGTPPRPVGAQDQRDGRQADRHQAVRARGRRCRAVRGRGGRWSVPGRRWRGASPGNHVIWPIHAAMPM